MLAMETHWPLLGLCVIFIFIRSNLGLTTTIGVRQGDHVTFLCPYRAITQLLTWDYYIPNQGITTIASCYPRDKQCVNYRPNTYQGSFSNSTTVSLDVNGVLLNETIFRCYPDLNDTFPIYGYILKTYVWPDDSRCFTYLNETYIRIYCNTSNVFPAIIATLERAQAALGLGDVDSSYCTYQRFPQNQNSAECNWFISIRNLLPNNNFYVYMSANVSNNSAVIESPVLVLNTTVNFELPVAVIDLLGCPVKLSGNYTYTGNFSRSSVLNCTCFLIKNGTNGSRAVWKSKNGLLIGESIGNGSQLAIYYNNSDTSLQFDCTAVAPIKVQLPGVKLSINFVAPAKVAIDGRACPLFYDTSTSLYLGYIPSGVTASCRCVLTSDTGGRASWWDRDGNPIGVTDSTNQFSTLTLSYSSSGNPSTFLLECRGESLPGYATSIHYKPIYIPSSTQVLTVEKGQSLKLDCSWQNPGARLTWLMVSSSGTVPVSACNLTTRTCSDQLAPWFTATAPNNALVQLNIRGASTNQTRFACQADSSNTAQSFLLQVYGKTAVD